MDGPRPPVQVPLAPKDEEGDVGQQVARRIRPESGPRDPLVPCTPCLLPAQATGRSKPFPRGVGGIYLLRSITAIFPPS